jgi:hypothetical protein
LILSLFLGIISFFSRNKSCFSELEYFLGIFGTVLTFKSLEGVASSGEVSEGSVIFRVLNEDNANILVCNTFLELVPEVEGVQIGAISGGTVSIQFTVSLVLEMEKKYSDTLLRFK